MDLDRFSCILNYTNTIQYKIYRTELFMSENEDTKYQIIATTHK